MRKKSFLQKPGVPFKIFSKSISLQERHYSSYLDLAKAAYKFCQLFLNSSPQVSEAENRVLSQLIGYSTEISLKAFILCKDYSEEIRDKIKDLASGHNLEFLLNKAKEKGLTFLNNKEIKLICKLNKYYEDSGFRYYEDKKSKETLFFLMKPQNIKGLRDIINKVHKGVALERNTKNTKTKI